MKARSSRKSKSPKKPLGYRLGQRLRAAGNLGRDAVTKPSSLPGHAQGFFRRWFRKVWDVRGGGLYACGYAVCFIWFEAKTLAGEIAQASGVGDFFSSQIVEFLTRFTADTIENMVNAFIWPVYVIELNAMWGGMALGLAFWLFPIYVKPHIERWLFDDDEPKAESGS